MRIGLFSDTFPPEINGVANSTYILRKELEKLGHDVYVITTNSEGGVATHWEDNGRVLRFRGAELKFLYGYVMTSPFHFKALQEIRALDLDIIHAQTEFGIGIFAHICSSQLDIPLVSTYHTTYEDYTHYINFINSPTVDEYAKKLVARLSKLYGNSSVRVIAPSEKTKAMLEGYHIRTNIDVIPTGLELDEFSPEHTDPKKTKAIREKYGFKMDDTLLLSVGRLAEEKSIDVVIRCVKYAVSKGLDAKMLIVGGGPDFDKLSHLIEELGLNERIKMAGPLPKDDISDICRAADAFVSASLTETQGMTFIEALAAGIPLFARYDDVLADLVENDVTGWFYEDEKVFAERFKHFMSLDQIERHEISLNCVKRVSSYSGRTFGENVIQVYEKALDAYHGYSCIDDVSVKDTYIQLHLLSGSKEESKLFVTMDDYADLGLRKGGMISKELVEQLTMKQEGVLAYQSCIRRITMKDRTRKEMYDWLCKETKCDIRTVNNIIEKLEGKGYIDDERYCEEAISSMHASFQGTDKICRDLVKKGLPIEMIHEKLAEQPNTEAEDALTYAQKLLGGLRTDSVKRQKYLIRNKLILRGYSSEIAENAVEKLDFSRSETRELDNLKRCAVKAKRRYERQYSGAACRNRVFRYCAGQGYKSGDIYAVIDEMEWNDDKD